MAINFKSGKEFILFWRNKMDMALFGEVLYLGLISEQLCITNTGE